MKTFLNIFIIIAGICLAGYIIDPSSVDDPNSYHGNVFESLGRGIIGTIVIIITIVLLVLLIKGEVIISRSSKYSLKEIDAIE